MTNVPDRVRRHARQLLTEASRLQEAARAMAESLGRAEAAHRNHSADFRGSERQRVAAGLRRLRVLCRANGVDASALCAECRTILQAS